MNLEDNITSIKGIGQKTSDLFHHIGIYKISDLIYTYPRKYVTYEEPVDIASASDGERHAIMAIIVSHPEVKKVRNLTITSVSVRDATGSVRITWFNSPFMKNVFHKGDTFIFVGEIKIKNNMRVMDMPEYYTLEKYKEMTKVWQPVYPLTHGLSNKTFQKAVKGAVEVIKNTEDYLPVEIRNEYELMPRNKALYNMHFPKDEENLVRAIKRMAFDEFLSFLYEMRKIKKENAVIFSTHKVKPDIYEKLTGFINNLPFKLTDAQKRSVNEIYEDMKSDSIMNRLLQGDVGSGKTIVAAAALYVAVISGWQGALMVPTEVLAYQHFNDLKKVFEPYNIAVECLTGATPVKEKRKIYEKLKNHEIDIIIGTHALIQEGVEYHDLGLVITDEQHRFGVRQRKKLSEKGNFPHMLVMSATPIPRTLAIIMYADLDISVIGELPKGRIPIKNCVVGTEYRRTSYNFILSEVKKGHQAYVICPLVEESEALDAENVIEYAEKMKGYYGDSVRVRYLHGKMSNEEKNEILQEFVNRETDVLVSTTVIEVGINNPNATVMMIENSERFGLAQLHQLRGRVGRGSEQSYCIFINGKKSKESTERLMVLKNSNDGFYIASEDLKLRGPGDFFGIRQSGEFMFKLADIYNHADMLKKAQEVIFKYENIFEDTENKSVPLSIL